MKTDILVSDHSVLRWLERIEGYDIEGLRADIARIAEIGIAHGAPVVIVGRGKVVMNATNTAVLTVLPRHAATKHENGRISATLDPQHEPEFKRRKPRRRI
jgi:hypothetical protein